MICRIYPDKMFTSSTYFQPIVHYAKTLANVYVSLADPFYYTGSKKMEVPQIEQDELWHALKYSDVIVNHFSTMGLEACMFDKPVIYILYFPRQGYTWIQPPVYYDHGLAIHNRRMLGYGITRTASNQEELLEAIKDALAYPEKYVEKRREVVEQELGPLDGKACQRLVDSCVEAYWDLKKS
jgi:CDP-glycerol glycerophosphotransferase (TagB/SpsB family)